MRIIEVIKRGRRGEDGRSNLIGVTEVSGTQSLTDADSGKAFRATGVTTLTIPASLTPGWSAIVDADGGAVTLSSTATINGASSLVVSQGNAVLIYSDGDTHFARFFLASELTALNATAVGFTPITGNSATTVAGAIANLTGLWNAVTAYGKSLIAAADASAARTVLGLGSAATRSAEDTLTDGSNLPDGAAVKAYVDTTVAADQWKPLAVEALTGESFVDFTGLPADVTEIELFFNDPSLDGTNHILVQLLSSGVVASGYNGNSTIDGRSTVQSADGFLINAGNAARVTFGRMQIIKFSDAAWMAFHKFHEEVEGFNLSGTSKVTGLTNPVDGIRVTVSGTNLYDGGTVKGRYRSATA